jgi:hypothetical protein
MKRWNDDVCVEEVVFESEKSGYIQVSFSGTTHIGCSDQDHDYERVVAVQFEINPEDKRTDLDDFVACYNPKNRHERKESERFKGFGYDVLLKREKVNLDKVYRRPDPTSRSVHA